MVKRSKKDIKKEAVEGGKKIEKQTKNLDTHLKHSDAALKKIQELGSGTKEVEASIKRAEIKVKADIKSKSDKKQKEIDDTKQDLIETIETNEGVIRKNELDQKEINSAVGEAKKADLDTGAFKEVYEEKEKEKEELKESNKTIDKAKKDAQSSINSSKNRLSSIMNRKANSQDYFDGKKK